MACVSAVQCPKVLRGPRVCLKASTARPSVLARAAENAAQTGSLKTLGDADFKSAVLESSKPVLVEFWATWCGPCKMLDPVLADLAEQMSDEIDCFQMDTDKEPKTASEYGVRSIPTVMIFKGGKRIDTVIGAVPKASLKETIKNCIV